MEFEMLFVPSLQTLDPTTGGTFDELQLTPAAKAGV